MDPTKKAESNETSKHILKNGDDSKSKTSANSSSGNVNITPQALNTIHTKISKLVYDPQASPTKMNIKSIHTQMNKECSKLIKKGVHMRTFKSKNINPPQLKQQNDSNNKLNPNDTSTFPIPDDIVINSKSENKLQNHDIVIVNSKNESEKQKPYTEEAKKVEHKKKRKNFSNSENSKNHIDTGVDKTEIKKRLDRLRKNTLRILERNVNLAKKRSSALSQENSPRKTRKIDKTIIAPKLNNQQKTNVLKSSNSRRMLHIEKTLVPNDATTEIKRIGLLRKPHLDDNLSSTINNKENLDLTNLTPKTEINKMLDRISESVMKRKPIETIEPIEVSEQPLLNFLDSETEKKQDCYETFQQTHKHEKAAKEQNLLKANHSENEILDELLLTVPNASIDRKPALEEKSIQCDSISKYRKPLNKFPAKQIPYWLKPSPIQIYPYNFIMAVRKKLEAITNPKICANQYIHPKFQFQSNTPLSHLKNQETACHRTVDTISNTFENNEELFVKSQEKKKESISNIESNQFDRINKPKVDINEIRSMTSDLELKSISDNAFTPISNNKVNSKSFTDSNFSSISIQINPFSATNKSHRKILSSTKVDNKFISDDTTTISSSIFSSPEKKQQNETGSNSFLIFGNENRGDISPLSVENISSLKIQSKFLPSKDVNCCVNQLDAATTVNKLGAGELDYNQLLKDFNDSLSRVVTVNEQLKLSLNKPEHLISAKQKFEPNNNKEHDYTSDFEEESRSSQRKSRSSISVSNLDPSLNMAPVVSGAKNVSAQNFNFHQHENQNVKVIFNTKIDSDDDILDEIPCDAKTALLNTVPKDSSKLLEPNSNSEELLNSYSLKSKTSKCCSLLPSSSHHSSVPKSIYSAVSEESSSSQIYSNLKKKSKANKISSNITTSSTISEALVLSYTTEKNSDSDDVSIVHSEKTFLLNNKKDVNYLSTTAKNEPISSNSKSRELPPPAYNTINITNENNIHDIEKKLVNTSISSEFIAVFNQSDVELSLYSQSQSETTINYSSIGMYEQLLQNENRKSEQLSTFLKMREKVILNRAKRQVTWLELQKEKLRSHKEGDQNIASQLSTLKKKQRAVLMRMEKEQDEVKRLIQNQIVKENIKSTRVNTFRSPKFGDNISEIVIKKGFSTSHNSSQQQSTNTPTRPAIVRGIELKGNNRELEVLLKNREEQLEKRREHVQRLLQWNQRLDKEEEEVLRLEQMLYKCNLNEIAIELSADKKEKKKLKRIDSSLKKLNNISNESSNGYIRVEGRKLNQLWYYLTGEKNDKLNKNINYKLCKSDLENLYEKAKAVVIRNFNSEEFLKQSKVDNSESSLKSISNLDSEKEVKERNISKPNSENKKKSSENKADKKAFAEKFDNSSASLLTPTLHSVPLDIESADSFSIKIPRTKSQHSSSKAVNTTTENINENTSASANIYSSSTDKESLENSPELFEIELNNSERTLLDNETSSDSNSENLLRPTVIVSVKNVNDECPTTKVISEGETTRQSSDCLGIISEFISPSNKETESEKATNLEEICLKPSTTTNKIEGSKINILSTSDTCENISSLNSSNFNVETQHNSEASDVKENNEDKNEYVKSFDYLQYENDIFDSKTIIEDISLPKFESALEEESYEINTNLFFADTTFDTNGVEEIFSNSCKNRTELEKRLIDIDDSLKDLSTSFERALSPNKSSNIPPPNMLTNRQQLSEIDKSNIKPLKCDLNNGNGTFQTLMPDIISEVDIRRNQICAENEVKPSEYAIPYIFQREIPNKPPPPYHAPAHGSPMTIIFPSENRIKEITFQRTKELYHDITKFESIATIDDDATKPPTNVTMTDKKISCDNITNIYERIVLDICKEYIDEYKNIIYESNPDTYKNSLAFFNPPDKLICLQEYIYKNVRKSLGMGSQTKPPRNNSVYSVSKCIKRDNVDEILIQELYEEESKWNQFDLEESEVKKAIIENFGANEILVLALFENPQSK